MKYSYKIHIWYSYFVPIFPNLYYVFVFIYEKAMQVPSVAEDLQQVCHLLTHKKTKSIALWVIRPTFILYYFFCRHNGSVVFIQILCCRFLMEMSILVSPEIKLITFALVSVCLSTNPCALVSTI